MDPRPRSTPRRAPRLVVAAALALLLSGCALDARVHLRLEIRRALACACGCATKACRCSAPELVAARDAAAECQETPPSPAASNAGGWMLLALGAAVLVFELWAYRTGRPTISQWIRRRVGRWKWWGLFGGVLLGSLLWHLLFGGPI